MKTLYYQKSGRMVEIPEEDVEETISFYKLNFKVWDSYFQEFTNTLTNARQDIFMWDKE